jgi:hypothetical protein
MEQSEQKHIERKHEPATSLKDDIWAFLKTERTYQHLANSFALKKICSRKADI